MIEDLAPPVPDGFVKVPWREGFDHAIGPLYAKRDPNGNCTMGFRVAKHHVNGRGQCHGGMLAGFADMAWGQSLMGRFGGWATVRLTTDFMSNTTLGSWVEAAGVTLSQQDDVYTIRGRIWSGDRTLVTGVAIYKGLERPTAALGA